MIHKKCACGCGKIGHKPDMVKHIFSDWDGSWSAWYHEECYIKRFNVKKVLDINGKVVWVKQEDEEEDED